MDSFALVLQVKTCDILEELKPGLETPAQILKQFQTDARRMHLIIGSQRCVDRIPDWVPTCIQRCCTQAVFAHLMEKIIQLHPRKHVTQTHYPRSLVIERDLTVKVQCVFEIFTDDLQSEKLVHVWENLGSKNAVIIISAFDDWVLL